MADETEEELAAAAAAKKKKMIIGGVIAAGAIYRFVLSGGAEEVPPEGLASVPEEVEIAEGDILPIPEMTLNLGDEDELRFARVGLAVILLEGEDPVVSETKLPLVQDVAVTLLSTKTFDQLRKPGEIETLKEEMTEKVREEFENEVVARVLITSFVMQ